MRVEAKDKLDKTQTITGVMTVATLVIGVILAIGAEDANLTVIYLGVALVGLSFLLLPVWIIVKALRHLGDYIVGDWTKQ